MNDFRWYILKFYLFMEVYVDGGCKFVGELVAIDKEFAVGIVEFQSETGQMLKMSVDVDSVFPILKTADNYNNNNAEFQKINEDFTASTYNSRGELENYEVDPAQLLYFTEKGYGAIPDEDSPTGYSEFFDIPCVTHEQVANGVEIL